jgi:Asp-tRNA(Asn)/Glu-tRNA(Gln) amidotransferase A subunit family amidase
MVCSRYDRLSNISGCPALVVPVGATRDRLPIALQLIGPPLGEARLLAVAAALEQAMGHLAARWGIEVAASTSTA